MPSFDDVQVNVSIEADPCDTCINKAREEGREEAEVSL